MHEVMLQRCVSQGFCLSKHFSCLFSSNSNTPGIRNSYPYLVFLVRSKLIQKIDCCIFWNVKSIFTRWKLNDIFSKCLHRLHLNSLDVWTFGLCYNCFVHYSVIKLKVPPIQHSFMTSAVTSLGWSILEQMDTKHYCLHQIFVSRVRCFLGDKTQTKCEKGNQVNHNMLIFMVAL